MPKQNSVKKMIAGAKKKRALDLFCGSGSVAHALRREGYEVITLDVDPHCNANFVVDVLEWPVEDLFRPGFFDLVAASPPCTEYSAAMTRRPRNMDAADQLVQRTIDIETAFKATCFRP
jgi:site-specific DNA-cytosine methylase